MRAKKDELAKGFLFHGVFPYTRKLVPARRWVYRVEALGPERNHVTRPRALATRALLGFRRSHGEDDAKLGFATHHAGVGFIHFIEGKFFDHGADAG